MVLCQKQRFSVGRKGDKIREKRTILAEFGHAGLVDKAEVDDEYDIIRFGQEQGGGGWK